MTTVFRSLFFIGLLPYPYSSFFIISMPVCMAFSFSGRSLCRRSGRDSLRLWIMLSVFTTGHTLSIPPSTIMLKTLELPLSMAASIASMR